MGDIARKKRIRVELYFIVVILILLVIKIAWIQFIQGEELKVMAYRQQSLDRKINPKRGTIYDSEGTVIAISATVNTITVNPTNISTSQKEKVARALSDIFNLDYETVLKKVKKNTSIESIIKKVDKEKADELRIWMEQNEITTGINIDEDTKRYYPYNSLAAHIIGFTGSDNQGLDGLEAKYDNILKGSSGRITRLTDAKGGTLVDIAENYEPGIDGNDIVLTIDASIQAISEKYLEEGCIDNNVTDGGNVIIMNPNNGDILAMATYPTYNLNEPYTINNEELKNNWVTLEANQRSIELQKMWRNKAIADAYEPGSTFKLITASAALEEGIASTDKEGEFNCSGSIEVAGTRIKCWRYYKPHGAESLRTALMNSCNPVFIGLGQKLGISTYYSYLRKFGLLEKTGIDLPGEASGIFLAENKAGPVELATISFGQRFEITPLQLITAVSSIANGGNLVKPRVVKQIIDNKTGEVTDIEPVIKNRVISKETSESVLSMMGSVVESGTGKNGQVKGYKIGGKTGTSEDGVNTGKYVASFMGVATIDNPELIILVTLYNPTGEGGHGGGGVAAPIASQILSEVLPYLEMKKDKAEEIEEIEEVEVPDIKNKTIKEAKKILKDVGLKLEYSDEVDENQTIIKEQTPRPGIIVKKESNIFIEI